LGDRGALLAEATNLGNDTRGLLEKGKGQGKCSLLPSPLPAGQPVAAQPWDVTCPPQLLASSASGHTTELQAPRL
jgi:hypothetical protein